MQLIKLLAPDQKMQRVPKALKVMGANRQEISLIGMVDIEVKFNNLKGDRCSSLTLKCVVAPEFDDGLLLSMGTMEDIGVQIILECHRSSISFRSCGVKIPVTRTSRPQLISSDGCKVG